MPTINVETKIVSHIKTMPQFENGQFTGIAKEMFNDLIVMECTYCGLPNAVRRDHIHLEKTGRQHKMSDQDYYAFKCECCMQPIFDKYILDKPMYDNSYERFINVYDPSNVEGHWLDELVTSGYCDGWPDLPLDIQERILRQDEVHVKRHLRQITNNVVECAAQLS